MSFQSNRITTIQYGPNFNLEICTTSEQYQITRKELNCSNIAKMTFKYSLYYVISFIFWLHATLAFTCDFPSATDPKDTSSPFPAANKFPLGDISTHVTYRNKVFKKIQHKLHIYLLPFLSQDKNQSWDRKQ